MSSQRQKQIESLLQRAVASVLQRGLADPRIKGLVSVTRVDVSTDFRHASVYVSITPEEYESRTIHGLKDATMHIQHQVNKAVALRIVPHLAFKIDQDLKKQAEIFAAIDAGMKRTQASETHADSIKPEAAERRDQASDELTDDPSPGRENTVG